MNEISIKKFLIDLSSTNPAPGGGVGAAVSAAIGIALSTKIIRFIIKRSILPELKKFKLEDLIIKNNELIDKFSKLAREDEEAVNRLFGTFQKEDNFNYSKDQFLKDALNVAEKMLGEIENSVNIYSELVNVTPNLLISDVGCSLSLIKASLDSSFFTAYANLHCIKNKKYTDQKKYSLKKRYENISKNISEILSQIKEILIK